MLYKRNLLFAKQKYPFILFILTCISVICVAFSVTGSDDFDFARREVLLRRIGHEILLQSGDSTSRVLPVKKIAGDEYQLSFENSFTFKPEALVNITQQLLAKDPLAGDYVVNVINCADEGVAYAYAVSKNRKDDIVTCMGRNQPVDCDLVNIKFKPAGIVTAKNGYLVGSFAALAFVGFVFFRSARQQKVLPETEDANEPTGNLLPGMFTLGAMLFDTEARTLTMNENTIELTRTETRVLCMFATAPNEIIERSRLQKEIWEDEGVIVGRSLDMFISKLRKKLEPEPNVKIVSIRGKGYKLEITMQPA